MMKAKELSTSQKRLSTPLTAQAIGLDPELYASALRNLFDRPVPAEGEQEWYWNSEEPEFEATPLEWTRIQTLLFANAGLDLAPYSDDQVGMGLDYVMSNHAGDIPYMAIDPSVPLPEAMRMMQAFPSLWRDCIGQRLKEIPTGVGVFNGGRLGQVCSNWSDVWPTFSRVRHIPEWRDALWNVLSEMLDVPCRAVQFSALNGIADEIGSLQRNSDIDQRIGRFIADAAGDTELQEYARAAPGRWA